MSKRTLSIELLTEIYSNSVLIVLTNGKSIIAVFDSSSSVVAVTMPVMVGINFTSEDEYSTVMIPYSYPLITFDPNKKFVFQPSSIESISALQIPLLEAYVSYVTNMIVRMQPSSITFH